MGYYTLYCRRGMVDIYATQVVFQKWRWCPLGLSSTRGYFHLYPRLKHHLCFSSSCATASNPAGQGSVKAGTHGVPWGGRMRPGLDGAQAGLPCAPPRRKKNAAATGRGRGGSRSPVVRHTAHSQRPLDQQRSAATDGGRGGAQPPHGTPAHASPSRHERAPSPCTRSACDRGPPGETSGRPQQRSAGSTAGRPTRQRATPCRPQGDVVLATDLVLAAPGCLKLRDGCWVCGLERVAGDGTVP